MLAPAEDASIIEKMRYLLKLPENRERYRKREQSAELVFGQIKVEKVRCTTCSRCSERE